MSVIASKRAVLRWRKIVFGRPRKTQLHGLSNPHPSGSAVKACPSLAMTLSNSMKGTLADDHLAPQIHRWRVAKRSARCSASSQIVFSTPSKSNPRMHVFVANCPSPFWSFHSEIGSLLETGLARKTSCISNMTPFVTWRIWCHVVGMTKAIKSLTYTSTK